MLETKFEEDDVTHYKYYMEKSKKTVSVQFWEFVVIRGLSPEIYIETTVEEIGQWLDDSLRHFS